MKGALAVAAAAFLAIGAWPAGAELPPRQGISLFGDLKYPPGFSHFEYVNPDAPKGGEVKLAELSTFDSLNPFILKGVKAPGPNLLFETLMTPSLDEPRAMYGRIAQSVERDPKGAFVIFTLYPQARWQDGTPITADDVVFSFDALKTKGDPLYKLQYAQVASAQKLGERRVKFTFTDPKNRELPLLAAALPVVSKAYYTTHDFEKADLTPPLGSGPYRVKSVDPGRAIVYERVKNYWGKDLPVNRGQYNFDTIRYDIYRDETVALEAFKAGEYDFRQEYIARNWATAYNIPGLNDGRLIKRLIQHQLPQGMQGFIFNTRKPEFADARVREAIDLTLDFEWMNKTMFYGAYERNSSFFANTECEAKALPDAAERALLAPYTSILPPQVFTEVYHPPVTDGSGNDRSHLLRAQKLLEEAGWIVKGGKRVNKLTGQPLKIEFLLVQPTMVRPLSSMRKNLAKLGIDATMRLVDDSQYQKRLNEYDFDVVSIWWNIGIFYPGNEQLGFWQSTQADVKGGNNLGGVKNPAVDAALTALAGAPDKPRLLTACRALDRVLLWEHYVIPHWHANNFRVAYWNKFGLPKLSPKYGLGFETWWLKPRGGNH